MAMETAKTTDPELTLRQDFEREDREDSRSLRWSLLAALAVHALLLTLTLPAKEAADPSWVESCSLRLSPQIYARPVRGPVTVPQTIPLATRDRVCYLFANPPQEGTEEPLLQPEYILDPELDPESFLRSESHQHATTRDLGVEPVLTHCVEPQWTEIARKVRIQGGVIVEILLREDGTVGESKVLKALPFGLTEAAVDAVAAWRYEPIEVEGKPTALRHIVVVRYELGELNCPRENHSFDEASSDDSSA